MNSITSAITSAIKTRTSDESGHGLVEVLLTIAMFLIVCSTIAVIVVQTSETQADATVRVAGEAADQTTLVNLRSDFYHGTVESVSENQVSGTRPDGEAVTYEVRETGDFVRITETGERTLTTVSNPENFAFVLEGGQIHFTLDSIASAITPDVLAPDATEVSN